PLFRRHARAVERRAAPVDPVGQAQAIEDLVVDPVPHARLVPVTQAPPAGHAGSAPHLLGQVLPGDAGAEDEENTSKDLSVRDSGPPTLGLRGLGRQERFDDRPQLVGYKSFFHTDLYPNEPVLLGTLSCRPNRTLSDHSDALLSAEPQSGPQGLRRLGEERGPPPITGSPSAAASWVQHEVRINPPHTTKFRLTPSVVITGLSNPDRAPSDAGAVRGWSAAARVRLTAGYLHLVR